MPADIEKPPVLLVHGFATSADRTWKEPGWVDLIVESGRSVIAPDLLGHGTAARSHDSDAYERLESNIAEQLPADGAVDAIGYSAGARVVLSLAAERPDRFRRLVLAGIGAAAVGLASRDETTPRLDLAPMLRGEREPANPIETRFLTMASSDGNDPLALAALADRRSPPLSAEAIEQITSPTLVVVGEHDFARPAEPLADRLPNGRLAVVRGVDHFGLPKAFDFLDKALDFIGAAPTF